MSNINLDNIISEIGSRYYKVGSVVITSTNTNPQSIYGGTWTLVRKRFKEAVVTNAFTFNTTNTQNGASVCSIYKDSILCRVVYYPKVAFADSTLEIATFDPTKIGIRGSSDVYTQYLLPMSDGLNAVDLVALSGTAMTHYDIVTKTTATSVAASTSNSFVATFPLSFAGSPTVMLDSFCDEFWWERTA